MTLKVKNMKTDINTDYLEAQSFMVSIFLTFVVPMSVFFFIDYQFATLPSLSTDPALEIANI